MFWRGAAALKQVKIRENSPDETVRCRGVRKVLPRKAATGRRPLPETGASRHLNRNLFADDGRIHRFDVKDQRSLARFFAEESATSALVCGDTESVLSRFPGGI